MHRRAGSSGARTSDRVQSRHRGGNDRGELPTARPTAVPNKRSRQLPPGKGRPPEAGDMGTTSQAPEAAFAERSGKSSSLERLLGILDLFSERRPAWSAEEIGTALSVSRATLYRYVKVLTRLGFLAPGSGSTYSLGPRIIEIERQMRQSDPLLLQGVPIMTRLKREFRGLQLLCRYYGERVLCIHQESSNPEIKSTMERGRSVPLFRGAPSRTTLAFLPTYRLRSIMLSHPQEIRVAGLGATWDEFRARLKAIRKAGYYVGRGEIDRGLVGVAAPVFRAPGAVIGSLCLIVSEKELTDDLLRQLRDMVTGAAARISERIAASSTPS